jgi:long-chain acyl-CoA synthetase
MRPLLPILRKMILAPFRAAVIDDQRTWKAIHLYIGALHLARAIERATDRPHVGVMLPTSGLFPMAMIATWMLGRTLVPLNYLLKADDLDYVINDAELDLVVTVGPMIDFIKSQVGGRDLPSHIKQLRLDEMSFRGLPPFRFSKRRPDDFIAVLLYTSGTSGKPKGVMLTCANLASNVQQIMQYVGFTYKDKLVGVLPQFHSFGLTVLTLLPLTVGCPVVYTAKFLPKKILDLLHKHRPTALIAIPSMYNALLHAKSATPDHFAGIKYIVSGGEPLPEAVFNGFREKLSVTINEGYGLTETSPVTNWCRPWEYRRKSVGKPLDRVEEIIVDPQGNRLGPNQDGEILMKGPNIMKGYYKLPEQTAAVFTSDGYFRTGDMGRFDDDGHLYITGRIKEMLIIGGENVFPREIEDVLDAHPSVQASAVIGVMDESRGEVPVAFVELKEGASFDETALRSHCRKHLAQYKVPRDIQHIEKLPRNPTGKIMRRELKSQAGA